MKRASTHVFFLVVVVCFGFHVRTASCEDRGFGPASRQPSDHDVLGGLDPAQRANASIDLEIPGVTGHANSLRAEQVEPLWNEGRQAEALAAVEDLKGKGITPAAGIACKDPVPSRSAMWYPDVVIGGGRTGFEDAAIGYDAASGNIFVLIQWADGWSMNISTDMGASFSETYFWPTHALVDMTVVGAHAWVGYAADAHAGSVRMRRFHVADGTVDTAYGWVEVDDIAPDTVLELIVESNAPDTNTMVYVVFTNTLDATIKIWYDDLTGTSFSLNPTGISYAWYGLDFAWNPYASSPTEGNFWISFIDSTPDIQVYTNTNTFIFVNEVSWSFTGSTRVTALSAHADDIYCVFEKDNGSGQNGVGYLTSSDAGDIWRIGDAFVPASGSPSAIRPNVTVRSGAAPAVIFTTDEAVWDSVWHTQRSSMAVGTWDAPLSFNNLDAALLTPTEIEWLDVPCVQSHGMVYGDDAGVPYFDLMTPRCMFSDGFESGSTSAWSSTTQ